MILTYKKLAASDMALRRTENGNAFKTWIFRITLKPEPESSAANPVRKRGAAK